MTLIKQALLVFALLQLLFGIFEYWYKPDIFHILARLIKPKYLFTSLFISFAYLIIAALLGYLFS